MTNRFPSVCFVAPNAFPLLSGDQETQRIGGAELQMVIVARLLARRGFRISMICLDFGQPQECTLDGITVLRAFRPTDGVPIVRFIWPRLTSIWACLERADAQVYYQQTAGMLTGVMAAFCKARDRISVFASASNPDLFRDTPRIRFLRDRWIYDYGLRRVDRIFVQNEEQARLCRVNFNRDSVLVPNCYSVPGNHQEHSQASRTVLWVSTIRRLKRPELFLDLAEALPQHEFRMIGGPGIGELELFDSIRSRASGIRNLDFLGFVPFLRTEEHFNGAELLINTSESEGFPNAFLQAWARGIPTVSFIDAGARFDGLTVGSTVATFEELVTTVSQLASDPTLRLIQGNRAKAYVEHMHSPEAVIPIYEREFMELALRRNSSGN